MSDSFTLEQLADYEPIKFLIKESAYLLCDNVVCGSVDQIENSNSIFLNHIKEAENQSKVAIFFNLDFGELNITSKEFYIPIIFYNCRFHGVVKLSANQFFYPVFFHSTNFKQTAKFKLSYFFDGLAFVKTTFHDEVSFERAKFLANHVKYLQKKSLELEIAFPGSFSRRNTVDFLGVKFTKEVSFAYAHCGCSMLFAAHHETDTVFLGRCDFSCVQDEIETLNFMDNKKEINKIVSQQKQMDISLDSFHRMTFLNIEFKGELSFENRNFQKKTVFKDVIFYYAPKFHNCKLHQDTDFHGAEFKDTYSEGAEHAYRSLKHIMDKERARREENMFFALEQKCLLYTPLRSYNIRVIDKLRSIINHAIISCITPKKPQKKYLLGLCLTSKEPRSGFHVTLTEKIISFLYLIISNYGQSIKRPSLILLFLVLVIFPNIYMLFFNDIPIIQNSWGAAYRVSMQQLFRPFDIYSVKLSDAYLKTPFSFYFIATIQCIFNIGLITSTLLAVRGRFRMY